MDSANLAKYQRKDRRPADCTDDVHFSAANFLGVPFRGKPGMFKRKELETFADVVHDVGIRLFNMQDEADAMALAEILDGAQNSWRRIIDYRPEFVKQADGSLHCYVLCAWSTPYAELTDARRRSLEL